LTAVQQEEQGGVARLVDMLFLACDGDVPHHFGRGASDSL
jgi:hypothetical protein